MVCKQTRLLTILCGASLTFVVGYLAATLLVVSQRHSTKRCAVVPPRHRKDLGKLLERCGLTVGAELGVQWGANAVDILSNWHSCKHFYLVDAWREQANYRDAANVDNAEQTRLFELARTNLAQWSELTIFLRMYTRDAAKLFAEASLDFVYVDARHDYCGCSEDIELFWPKLRAGGLMAGHDYVMAAENPDHDWSLCANGTRHPGAVKGAVDDFAAKYGLQVSVTCADKEFPSWIVRKET